MLTPAATSFSAIVATTTLVFIFWHTYHYDKCRCLFYSKKDWFRTLVVQILVLSVSAFMVSSWISLQVMYDEYYVMLDHKTMPCPWQLWSDKNLGLWRASLYTNCAAWSLLQVVHLEEFLYWGYLIHGIRTFSGARTTWLASPFFKVWVGGFLCALALLFGATHIENTNLDMMRAYIVLVGSSMSLVLVGASVTLCFYLPQFIERVRRQGATHEVLERLYFFQEMNGLRTVFRFIYTVCFFIMALDAITKEKRVDYSKFWSDLLYLFANLALFISSCAAITAILPRNMTSESLPGKDGKESNPRPMVAYRRPTLPSVALAAAASSPLQFYELGHRLNVEREELEAGLIPDQPAYEMQDSPKYPPTDSDSERGTGGGGGYDHREHLNDSIEFREPFATAGAQAGMVDEPAGRIKRTRFSQLPSLPGVMAKFRNIENEERRPEPPRVIVTTTVERY